MKKFVMKHRLGILFVAVVAILSVFGGLEGASIGLASFAFAGVTTTDKTDGESGIPANRVTRTFTIRKRLTIALALQVATDVLQVINVKAGWLVKNVHLIMVTPTTGDALTADVGDGGAVAGFDTAMSLKGAAGTRTYGIDGTDAYVTAAGRYYAADDTIDLKFVTVTNPAGVVVVDVIAEVQDLNA